MSGEKTEQPTAKKIRDARQRGEVAKSKDFTQTVLVVALFAYLVAAGNHITEQIMELMVLPAKFIGTDFREAISIIIVEMLQAAFLILMPVLLIVLVLGIFIEGFQTGLNISFEALKPSAKKLNVISNAKNIFSKNNFVEFLKNFVKVGIISFITYILVKDALGSLMAIPYEGMVTLGALVGTLLTKMIIWIGLAYFVISMADFVWQRFQYRKKLMMSKDEVKQEFKSSEGDPLIKSQRRGLHIEMLSSDAVSSTRKASVLVTNPTHLAIAIRYEEGDTPLPVVLAKGEGALAERMMEAARESGVPIMQNIPLARALFEQADLDHYIPSDLIEPVAEVLKLVKTLGDERGAG
jgi:type III secretion protein U